MELKNYNRCLIFLSDFIEAKISYFDCPGFVNMFTNYSKDNSEGKLYLLYKFNSSYELEKKIEEFSNNRNYRYWIPYITQNNNYIMFVFEVSKDKIRELELCKKGRSLEYYEDIKDLVILWKNYLPEFNDLLKLNDFDSDYTCTC